VDGDRAGYALDAVHNRSTAYSKEVVVFLPTSQWSLKACQGAEGSPRKSGPGDTPRSRSRDAERICRALVAFTTPDGAPVLRRALSPPERKRLSARAADLEAALAPARRALAQISAVLKAPISGDLASPQRRTRAEDVFGAGDPPRKDPSSIQQDEAPR
jgi:hypothetical protein